MDSASCDTIVLLNGERIGCIVKKVRSSKVLYKPCHEPDGAIITIAKTEVASVSYHGSAETKVNAQRKKLELLGIVGLAFATASLICAIFRFHAFFPVDCRIHDAVSAAPVRAGNFPLFPLLPEPVMRQFLDVVHQAVQLPLRIDLLPPT